MPDVTQRVVQARKGEEQAASQLVALLYEELRKMAAECLRGERPDHSLPPTALVHEVYLRLVDRTKLESVDRRYFLAVAAREMHRVLTDHARRRHRAKRHGGWARVILDQAAIPIDAPDVDFLDIDAALSDLTKLDPRMGRVVELRFFSELTVGEVAEVLGISPATVKNDWCLARAWLYSRLRSYESR